jgi:hypothetical protein
VLPRATPRVRRAVLSRVRQRGSRMSFEI